MENQKLDQILTGYGTQVTSTYDDVKQSRFSSRSGQFNFKYLNKAFTEHGGSSIEDNRPMSKKPKGYLDDLKNHHATLGSEYELTKDTRPIADIHDFLDEKRCRFKTTNLVSKNDALKMPSDSKKKHTGKSLYTMSEKTIICLDQRPPTSTPSRQQRATRLGPHHLSLSNSQYNMTSNQKFTSKLYEKTTATVVRRGASSIMDKLKVLGIVCMPTYADDGHARKKVKQPVPQSFDRRKVQALMSGFKNLRQGEIETEGLKIASAFDVTLPKKVVITRNVERSQKNLYDRLQGKTGSTASKNMVIKPRSTFVSNINASKPEVFKASTQKAPKIPTYPNDAPTSVRWLEGGWQWPSHNDQSSISDGFLAN